MTQSIVKVINIALIIINALVFLVPKKPMSGVNSNAAGILGLIALVIGVVFVAHLILTAVALYYDKIMLLKVLAFLIVPCSLVFWFFMVPTIKLW